MESVGLMNFKDKLSAAFRGKTVLITGHTGFKGGWLALWLHSLGAKIIGYSLDPPTDPSFFQETGLKNLITDIRADILQKKKLDEVLEKFHPGFSFSPRCAAISPGFIQEPVGRHLI